MRNLYLYRRIAFEKKRYPNPYLSNLEGSLSRNFKIVNKKDNKIGVLEPFKFLFKADIFYFNWIENITNNKFGKLQSLAFIFFLRLARAFGKTIVWTLHNKYAHDQQINYWTDLMYNALMKHSHLILTHSQAGVDFVNEKYARYSSKSRYIVHPVAAKLDVKPDIVKKYDLLVWGIIQPYKGIVEFMRFVHDDDRMRPMRILIAGKCFNGPYKERMNSYLSDNMVHLDEFFTLEEIAGLAAQSKFILFPYRTATILSSGSLMDSVAMQTQVIGPNDGAFKDLSAFGFVRTYNSLDELPDICAPSANNSYPATKKVEEFCIENTWEKFTEKFTKALSDIADGVN